MEFLRRSPGCSGKYRKFPRTCLVPDPVVLVFACWPPNAPNCSAAWPPAHLPNKDAYRAEIILRVAVGQTDAAIAHDMGLAVRTVFVWRHRFAEQRLDGLKDRPKCPPPRQYHADVQARLLVLACQKPSEVDPTRAGQTHWSIKDLAQYVAAHPELGLGRPSKSTIGVILKRHQVRLDRL